MRLGHYILDESGEKIIPVDMMTWARWVDRRKQRIVKQEHVGRSWISTVFLGLDHNFEDGAPVLWETMVFGGKLDHSCERCSGGREQAEAMHAIFVRQVSAAERWWLWIPPMKEFLFDQLYDLAYPMEEWWAARKRRQSTERSRRLLDELAATQSPPVYLRPSFVSRVA